VTVVDFDPAHKNADDVPHAGSIETIQAVGYFGREVFEAADYE